MIVSSEMRFKSIFWHRLDIVLGIFAISVVARKNFTWEGGSSNVFNNELKASLVSMCTSSMI